MRALIKINVILLALIFFSTDGWAQKRKKAKADEDTQNFRYEVECYGTGKEGTYLVKVWSYSKKPAVAKEQSKKNAIHGVIFKGVPALNRKCVSQKPLARNPNVEQEKAEFFKDFFAEGGKYLKFVSLSNDGKPGPGDVIKSSKKEYKVGVVVVVQKDLLRKDLEAAGIIRGLSSGF